MIYWHLEPEIRAGSGAGRPSLMATADVSELVGFLLGGNKDVFASPIKYSSLCFLAFSKLWMQEFCVLHRSLAPLLSPMPLSGDSWAMAFPGPSDNWKAWWLAVGVVTICESEWFGECCVRGGRGGRGLCESQTASRGELLTPHRCQKAPRWPFTEPGLLMRKRVIIPLWGNYKHVLLWILTEVIKRRNAAEIWISTRLFQKDKKNVCQTKHRFLRVSIYSIVVIFNQSNWLW